MKFIPGEASGRIHGVSICTPLFSNIKHTRGHKRFLEKMPTDPEDSRKNSKNNIRRRDSGCQYFVHDAHYFGCADAILLGPLKLFPRQFEKLKASSCPSN
jgi:hypothetical protein